MFVKLGLAWRTKVAASAVVMVCSLAQTDWTNGQERPTSLDIVPADVSFYFASMNHQAQYEAVVNSNAYQQLMDGTVARTMRRAYRSGRRRGFQQFGRGNPFGQYLEAYSQTVGSVPGKMAMSFLREIFGNEFFIYAEEDWNRVSDAVARTYLRVFREVLQPDDLQNFDEETLAALLPVLREELEGVNTPTLVMGTVLDEPASIKLLLEMAEGGFNQFLNQLPTEMEYVAEAFEVIEKDDAYLLNLKLTSEMIPWSEMKGDPFFEEHGDEIRALLSGKSIAVTFGVKGNFLLLSVGPEYRAHHVARQRRFIGELAQIRAAAGGTRSKTDWRFLFVSTHRRAQSRYGSVYRLHDVFGEICHANRRRNA